MPPAHGHITTSDLWSISPQTGDPSRSRRWGSARWSAADRKCSGNIPVTFQPVGRHRAEGATDPPRDNWQQQKICGGFNQSHSLHVQPTNCGSEFLPHMSKHLKHRDKKIKREVMRPISQTLWDLIRLKSLNNDTLKTIFTWEFYGSLSYWSCGSVKSSWLHIKHVERRNSLSSSLTSSSFRTFAFCWYY